MKSKFLFSFIIVFSFATIASETNPTYHQDIAPLLGAKCLSCHGPTKQGAPFSLHDFTNVAKRAIKIKNATSARRMPPFLVDNSGQCNKFNNVTWLSDQEISLISHWVELGAPEGDPRSATKVPPPELSSKLDRIDAQVEMTQAYTPVGPKDEYRCFVLDSPTQASKYLTGYNVVPGNLSIVHHVILYLPTQRGQAHAEQLDSKDPKAGYECFGSSGTEANPLAVWAPGSGAMLYPKDTGIEIPASRKLILQVHYSLGHQHGQPISADKSKIELQLENKVIKPAQLDLFGKIREGEIPPGQKAFPVTITVPVDENNPQAFLPFTLYGVFPHMHLYGSNIQLEIKRKGQAQNACLMDVPKWNFHRQFGYYYTQPLEVNSGDEIILRCTYDTSSVSTPVKFGDMTTDEMCVMGLYRVSK